MNDSTAGILHRSLTDFLRFELDDKAIARLSWREFGNGLSLCRLAHEGARELVLYRIAADAAADAFVTHEHVGGEFYLVLKGKIVDETGEVAARWTWHEFLALPAEETTVDIHCVTKWSKLATTWRGVPVDVLMENVDTSAEYVVAFCDGGYTTNLPLAEVLAGTA